MSYAVGSIATLMRILDPSTGMLKMFTCFMTDFLEPKVIMFNSANDLGTVGSLILLGYLFRRLFM